MDVIEHNRISWDDLSKKGCRWSIPVSSEAISAARKGTWDVILTPNKNVPKEWFGQIEGKRILCLASGGGQQAPILAAAGGIVTSFDNSEMQLNKDKFVADRDALNLQTVRGNMADLSVLENESFDLIFHPVSNVFSEEIEPVWRECSRVLKTNGRLLAGFMNPAYFLFDPDEVEQTKLPVVKYTLPYSDLHSLPEERIKKLIHEKEVLEFSHSLEEQIGGQLKAGFVLTDLYEDDWDDKATPLNKYFPIFIATLAVKMRE